ncbi:UNC-like C-terminal-domain-containing protein [Diplogelasinospora grovesii]|uniref:UNC-like C-terminal-domain-containing protein n=1 Tax=Diplogelasinospora grovesii TaxID=303347 RepID=A0AAN6S492_9PEZI|nr:UNC-like C-terminal-domain-containing protein [Diplogelasinospora grovesii]
MRCDSAHRTLGTRLRFALVLLGLYATAAHGSKSGQETALSTAPVATEVCEARTINYITHTLPQQCLRTSWTSPTPTAGEAQPTESATASQTPQAAQHDGIDGQKQKGEQNNTEHKDADSQEEDLATSSFMSFEEWKEMMLRKSGQDPANIKGRKQQEQHHRGDRDAGMGGGELYSMGEEGEISLDFDALAEKVSGLTGAGSQSGGNQPQASKDPREEQVFYDDGKTQYYRSKDAGKTCKERFSYSSFDAGATVLKTSPGAKNAKAILVENKDSYMLLECHQKNKFVVVELSDDILVDTIVLANFEFFSSMIRRFRVSVSDRYPVKLDKWVDLGTFEARNSRDIQAFLVEHPQIYTKYIRIEFLTHYGNEYYCPVSLLRVHGTRMLDTWKDPDNNHDDEAERIESPVQEQEQEPEPEPETTSQAPEPVTEVPVPTSVTEEEAPQTTQSVTEVGLSPWCPSFFDDLELDTCVLRSPTTGDPTPVSSHADGRLSDVPQPDPATTTAATTMSSPSSVSLPSSTSAPEPASTGRETNHGNPYSTSASPCSSPVSPVSPSTAGHNSSTSNPGHKHTATPTTTTATTTSHRSHNNYNQNNKTNPSSSSSPASAPSPTVQESFFKTITKRLQLLESNTSLSLQYIEDQSRFLQEALLKIEKKQITRVDAFLDSLNKTVLTELRNVRNQYDQIWQSTVIALETQREQSAREIVALSSRLNILADEVVFQKRMAILQSILLLSCLLLVIFSNSPTPLSAPATVQRNVSSATIVKRQRSYTDKTLPMTPTSPSPSVRTPEYGREDTEGEEEGETPPPMIRVDNDDGTEVEVQQPFFISDIVTPPPQRQQRRTISEEEIIVSSPSSPSPSPISEAEGDGEEDTPDTAAKPPPSSSGRSSATTLASQLGSSGKKPLPALPEDPT